MGAACSVEIVRQYRSSPLIVSYTIHQEDNYSHVLPDILICPFSRFNLTFFEENDVSQELIEYIQEIFAINPPYEYYWMERSAASSNDRKYPEVAKELDRLQMRFGNVSFEELIDKATFNCSDIVEYCVNTSGLVEDCCRTAKSVYLPPSKCYIIKGEDQLLGGFGYGITIVIKTPDENKITWGRRMLHNTGVSVKLFAPTNGHESDLTFIPPGVHALMPLKATKYEFMNDPPRYSCMDDTPAEYSPSSCLDECIFEHSINICNCRMLVVKSHGVPACTPWMQTECFLRSFLNMSKDWRRGKFDQCRERCKQPCDYWSYQPTISYANFPSTSFYEYLGPDELESEWSRYVILDVFYEKLEYTTIKHHHSVLSVTLMANIGGQVSLWIGGSILSLAQVSGLILTMLTKWYHRRHVNFVSSSSRVDKRKPIGVRRLVYFK